MKTKIAMMLSFILLLVGCGKEEPYKRYVLTEFKPLKNYSRSFVSVDFILKKISTQNYSEFNVYALIEDDYGEVNRCFVKSLPLEEIVRFEFQDLNTCKPHYDKVNNNSVLKMLLEFISYEANNGVTGKVSYDNMVYSSGIRGSEIKITETYQDYSDIDYGPEYRKITFPYISESELTVSDYSISVEGPSLPDQMHITVYDNGKEYTYDIQRGHPTKLPHISIGTQVDFSIKIEDSATGTVVGINKYWLQSCIVKDTNDDTFKCPQGEAEDPMVWFKYARL